VTAFGSTPFLYPIVDTGVCAARSIDPIALEEAYCSGGARILQLRHKDASGARFLSLADAVVRVARGRRATVIVNDRADIAMVSGAGGVHVGQEDLTVADVRRVLGDQAIVGISTHDRRQVDEALRSATTYVAVGPVFGTATKETGYTPRGLDLVRYAAGRGKPIVAIGGITVDNARSVVEAGASGLAVITDLLNGDPAARARAFIGALSPEGESHQPPTASR
jgi:thiamine-phosphate pyrophosphorylase